MLSQARLMFRLLRRIALRSTTTRPQLRATSVTRSFGDLELAFAAPTAATTVTRNAAKTPPKLAPPSTREWRETRRAKILRIWPKIRNLETSIAKINTTSGLAVMKIVRSFTKDIYTNRLELVITVT